MRTWLRFCAAALPLAAWGEDIKPALPPVHTSITIQAAPIEPAVDLRNKEVFEQTLFSRDDQVFHQLNAGINAGQHEGGGKSIEIRRFGFNLDHGGVNGGMKILVDNVQQNQTTQGHGQGYLGSLKSLTPELIQEVGLINGPFSAEYGDFSGLGVVHIRMRESLPDQFTIRAQGGSFHSERGFFAFSPDVKNVDSFFAYEGSNTDGPFVKPLGYRRDNLTANITKRLNRMRSMGLKFNGGLNRYHSSGQIPLDLVTAGLLDRFGYLDPGEGGRIRAATASLYYRQELSNGAIWKMDGFVTRSLFDLYSNFTYFLNDPVNGDAIQQHDSRLVQGANAQYLLPHKTGSSYSYLTAGGNFHANQINVALYPRMGRTPTGVTTAANANVMNGAGYVQENLSFLAGKLLVTGGLRFDAFRFDVRDRLDPALSAVEPAGRWQPKASLAWTPSRRLPVTLHANYGRGISSIDARSILTRRNATKVATTDFSEVGLASIWRRFSFAADAFWIDRSNELVYIADDGSLEFMGPSRAYGAEAKTSVQVTRHVSLSGGITQVFNAFYRATAPRAYVDRAPHMTANGAVTVAAWKGWSGSARVRAINSYRLDPFDASLRAAGNTVFDMSLVRRLHRNADFLFSIDNFTNRSYYETQNFVESRPYAGGEAIAGIHGTPGYPVTFSVGLTFRFRGK
ncbi:MAG TPA: TonB-dependent receptor [Bryobacteraceae bacterium]|nr:TonB-dependent receptor [Bryobacteraceae bacterium]